MSPATEIASRFGVAARVPDDNETRSTLQVEAGAIGEVCRFCRDQPSLDFQALSCLSGVDYADRLEVVYHLQSYRRNDHLQLRVRLPRDHAQLPSVSNVWTAADWHERECFDLFGVHFEGHPDLRRLLLPEDWQGYPLRKDYQPPTFYHGIAHHRVDPLTTPAAATTAPAVQLEPELKDLSELRQLAAPLSGEMIVNMGPQHPSTHGVLNFLLITDGEVMQRAVPHAGYLHRGLEKLAESTSYAGYMPFTDRVDYLAAMSCNHGYALATEMLLGCEVPPRAKYLRVIASELNRIASHLVATGTMAMDLGAFTPFLHWLREREVINDLIEKLCGSRLTYNYMRIGGVAYDLPDGFVDETRRWLDHFEPIIDEFDRLISHNEIFINRLAGVAVVPAEQAINAGLVGPNLRASGVDWDLRRDLPYSVYPELSFAVPLGSACRGCTGDCYSRFVVRVLEIRESCKILRAALAQLPDSEILGKVPKRIKLPEGEAYARVEAPRGEMGFYLISDGGDSPYRLKMRTGSFNAMALIDTLSEGVMIADLVAIIGSLDIVAPEVDR